MAARAASREPASIRSATRLCLDQIQLVVEKRALCELAGIGAPRPELHQPPDQCFDNDWPAMAVKLDHVLAGVGVRRGKEERQARIQGLKLSVFECCKHRAPRRWHRAQHGDGNALRMGSGQTHNGYAPPSPAA